MAAGAARATHMAWNFKDIMDVVLQSSCVTLVLSGHDHIGGYACIQGKHFVTLEALLEGTGYAWRFARLHCSVSDPAPDSMAYSMVLTDAQGT